jgi:hypothetical protein
VDEKEMEAILADPRHPALLKKSSSQMVLSPWDRNQALKHHPEFQRCLMVWHGIVEKEREGIALTPEEEVMKWAPRSGFNVEAEMEATRYGLLSLEEHERTTMTEEDLAWRDVAPQLDDENQVVVMQIPLYWTIAKIEKTVGRVVRDYKNLIGLSVAKYHGSPLEENDLSPSLILDALTLRIPLQPPVEKIDQIVGQVVRTYQNDLRLTPSQRIRRPEHIDPWTVYRLFQEEKLSLLGITHRLFETSGLPAYDDELNKLYSRVKRAYQFALKAIEHIGKTYGTHHT